MRIIFCINYYWLIQKLWGFENLFQIISQVTQNYQKIYKMEQSGGILGRLLGPLLKSALPLMKNVIKPLAKTIRVNSSNISYRSSYSYKNVCIWYKNINNIQWRNEWYHENSSVTWNI